MSEATWQTSGELFHLVQSLDLFGDSKTFPDAILRVSHQEVRDGFRGFLVDFPEAQDWLDARREASLPMKGEGIRFEKMKSALFGLVSGCFALPVRQTEDPAPPSPSMEAHVQKMWTVLTRRQSGGGGSSTLLPMKHRTVVPGGRFDEFYYWDSYFEMLGLAVEGDGGRLHDLVEGAAEMLDTFGRIPNGGRTYYLSRGQPPFFGHMLELQQHVEKRQPSKADYRRLQTEYAFRITGERGLREGAGKPVLGRYWDDLAQARPESYVEDRRLAAEIHASGGQSPRTTFRHLRAAAESGWDFSSRWLRPDGGDGWSLRHIRTTEVVPIDLNCLLWSMETKLAAWADTQPVDDPEAAGVHRENAERRRACLLAPPFWDENAGWFLDATWDGRGLGGPTGVLSLAGVMPLFCGLVGGRRANVVAGRLESDFLKPGGLVTTLETSRTGQQWDYPNGWAPLQWLAVAGLYRYGFHDLAREIARRFTDTARRVFNQTGRMMEKYDVCDPSAPAGGGEYPNQVGFGWTNGVVRALLSFLETGWLPGIPGPAYKRPRAA